MLENLNMETTELLMVAAIILGPILAVQAQKLVESYKEKRAKRMAIFTTLMSTRAERLHRNHVQALNMIDIEFYGRMIPFIRTRYQSNKEQAVTHAWKSYNSHLGERDSYETLDQWGKKGDEHFTNLLYAMSQALNYDYDKVQLQRDCYRPEAHGNIENTQLSLLKGLESIVNGERSLPMAVTYFPGVAPPAPEPIKEQESTTPKEAPPEKALTE